MKPFDFEFSEQYRCIGLNIAYYRKKKGLTQVILAEYVNASRTHVSHIEAVNMDTPISLDLLLRIAAVLEVPVGDLFEMR